MEPELPPEPSPTPDPQLGTVPSPAFVAALPLAVSEAPTYPDRSTGLVIFGVFQIILGLMAGLMVPFAALGAFMSRLAPGGGTIRPGQFVSGVAVYIFAAVVLLTLGIGSIQAKRWAYAITLVTSWYGLLTGILITVLITAVLPVTVRSFLQAQNATPAASPEISTGVMAAILTIIIVFIAFFLIVVPIAFVIFYSRKDVAETCRRRDPVERWTDRTPLPVLGASVVLATQALYLFIAGVTTPLFPLFGRYLYGIGGTACFLLVAGLEAYLAVAIFRLQSIGWWIAIVTAPVRLLSMAVTYYRADVMQAYSKMGISDEQLRVLNANPMFHSHVILWWSLPSVLILYGYLLWLKRYFKAKLARPQATALPAQAG